MKFTRGQAKQLRKVLVKAASSLPNEEIEEVPDYIEDWSEDRTYCKGDVVKKDGTIYRVKKKHEAGEDKQPDETTALFTRIAESEDKS